MYHVFCYYRYEGGYDFKGSVNTLKEAADLISGDFTDLFEIDSSGALREVASWDERGEMLGNGRQKKQTGWSFTDGKFHPINEWYEQWVENDIQAILKGLGLKPGQGVTGYIPSGQWVREE